MHRYFKDESGEVVAFSSDYELSGSEKEKYEELSDGEREKLFNGEKTEEELKQEEKQEKIKRVSEIIVITGSGKRFDGDEKSQDRMSRAVTASNAGEKTLWILADNELAEVTHEELREALRLAGEEMTRIWVTA